MRILFYGESPLCETGAGRVNLHLLDTIVCCGHTVEVIGFDHFWLDQYDHVRYPYHIMNTNDVEEARLEIEDRARVNAFDVLFISADMHVPNILGALVERFPSIVLAAIDGVVLKPDFVGSLHSATLPVVYSRFAYGEVIRHWPELEYRLFCTPLGCEPDVFYPVPEAVRREYRKRVFGIDDDTFLVSITNRNAMRKDIARGIKAFKLFHDRVPNSKLYLHMQRKDLGGDVAFQAELLGLCQGEFLCTGDDYNAVSGYSRDKLNLMYNSADVGISTARGEGWGLTTTEYMAAGTPFIGPRNTTFLEILGEHEERGYLATSGGDELWAIAVGQDDAPRPLTSVYSMMRKLEHVYYNREEARAKAVSARLWTKKHRWEQFEKQWETLLKKMEVTWQRQHLSQV